MNLADRSALAQRLALEAGRRALSFFGQRAALTVEKKGLQDLVSEADRQVETFLRGALAKEAPGDGFLGEESGGVASNQLWVVDPIDGTTNFLRGIPYFAISLAYVENGQGQVGVVHAPAARETFRAVRGQGSFLNDQPLRVSSCARLSEALIGFGYSKRIRREDFEPIALGLLARDIEFRRFGAGALDLCAVAAGRLDAFFELHLSPWDACAGLLVASEAGARVSDFLGGEGLSRGNKVLASCPELFDELSALTGIR